MESQKTVKTLPIAVMLSIFAAFSTTNEASASVQTFDLKNVNPEIVDAASNALSKLPISKLQKLQMSFSSPISIVSGSTTESKRMFLASTQQDSTMNGGNPASGISSCYSNCYSNCHTNCHGDCGGNDI